MSSDLSNTKFEASVSAVPRCSNSAAVKVWKEKFNNWVGSTYELSYCELFEPGAVDLFQETPRLGACPPDPTRADLEDRHDLVRQIEADNLEWKKYDSTKSRIIAQIKTAFEDWTQITHELRTDQILTVAMREHDLISFYKQLNAVILRKGYAAYTREAQLIVELANYKMEMNDNYHDFQHTWNQKWNLLRSIGCKLTADGDNDETWKIVYLCSLHDAYFHDWRARSMNEHCVYRALKDKWDTDPPLVRGAMPVDTLPATLTQTQRMCDDQWNTFGSNDIEKMRVTWNEDNKAIAAAQAKTIAAATTTPVVKPARQPEERKYKRAREVRADKEDDTSDDLCIDCPSARRKHRNAECWKKHPELVPAWWKTPTANPHKKTRPEINSIREDQDEDSEDNEDI